MRRWPRGCRRGGSRAWGRARVRGQHPQQRGCAHLGAELGEGGPAAARSAWHGVLSCHFPCCRGVPYLPPKTDSENPGFTVCVLEIKSYLCNSLWNACYVVHSPQIPVSRLLGLRCAWVYSLSTQLLCPPFLESYVNDKYPWTNVHVCTHITSLKAD